jgi:TonB family protein
LDNRTCCFDRIFTSLVSALLRSCAHKVKTAYTFHWFAVSKFYGAKRCGCAAYAHSVNCVLEPKFTEKECAARVRKDGSCQQFVPQRAVQLRGESYKRAPTVKYLIQEDGTVSDATIIRSSGLSDMDKKFVDAIAQWKYKPRPDGCGVIESQMTPTIHWDGSNENWTRRRTPAHFSGNRCVNDAGGVRRDNTLFLSRTIVQMIATATLMQALASNVRSSPVGLSFSRHSPLVKPWERMTNWNLHHH